MHQIRLQVVKTFLNIQKLFVENSNVEQIAIGVPNNYFFGHVDPFAENTVSNYECIDHKWAKFLPLPNSREDKCIGRKSY